MKKIPTDEIYMGSIVDSDFNLIRKILYHKDSKNLIATDLLYDNDTYQIRFGTPINIESGLIITNQTSMKKFLDVLDFKEEIGMLGLLRLYYLFMINNVFIENCGFMFGLEVDKDGNPVLLKDWDFDGSDLIDDYDTLLKLSSLPTCVPKEEKEKHHVRIKNLLK